MSEFIANFSFLQNSIIAILLLSILSGIIGSYITLNRLNYLSGAVAHSSFAGIGAGYYFGINPFIGGVIASVISAVVHSVFNEKLKERSDSTISIMWAFGMAIGIIFTELTPGYKPNLMSFLFGDILAVPTMYLYSLFVVVIVASLFFYFFYDKILAISFDEEFAKINNINVWRYKTLLLVLSSVTIILLAKVSGLILVIALITIPVTISNLIFKKIKLIIFSSIVIALIVQLFGLYLSFLLNISTGPIIISILVSIYFLQLFLQYFIKRLQ